MFHVTIFLIYLVIASNILKIEVFRNKLSAILSYWCSFKFP